MTELDIDTSLFSNEVYCEKCATTTCFAPDVPESAQVCFGCSPLVKTIGTGEDIAGYTETIVQVERPH